MKSLHDESEMSDKEILDKVTRCIVTYSWDMKLIKYYFPQCLFAESSLDQFFLTGTDV